MTKAIEGTIKGLKCDASDCNYSDMDIDVENYINYVNSPCPDCGENLLTEADYELVKSIMEITDMINEDFKGIDLPEGELETLEVVMDGSGIPKIKPRQ